jgi:hypothetical protein
MAHTLKAAAVQMDARPAPTAERLRRAGELVERAARAGAQLVVLPELFNTGYGYSDENFRRAELLDGPTATWLRRMAARHRVHLAGSLMVWDGGGVYNALLLLAPDGRRWRYDKRYPWGWERAYFRGGTGVTVAQTELGAIGLLVCWDVAHRDLWRQYAGRVDMMVITACPPDVTNPTFHFPNGAQVILDDFGRLGQRMKDTGPRLFGEMVNQQTAWLGVPAVQSVGTGHLRTPIPNASLSLLSYLPAAPKLVKHLPQARGIELACDFVPGCKLVDGRGVVQKALAQADGEAFTLGEVDLPDERPPAPQHPQPPSLLPAVAYLSSDHVLPLLMRSVYQRGIRRLAPRY